MFITSPTSSPRHVGMYVVMYLCIDRKVERRARSLGQHPPRYHNATTMKRRTLDTLAMAQYGTLHMYGVNGRNLLVTDY